MKNSAVISTPTFVTMHGSFCIGVMVGGIFSGGVGGGSHLLDESGNIIDDESGNKIITET